MALEQREGQRYYAIREYTPAEVEHIYRASGLRCASLEDFAYWWGQERYVCGQFRLTPSVGHWCDDAEGVPGWCAAERKAGRCRLHAKPRTRRLAGEIPAWLRRYLEAHGGQATRLEVYTAAQAVGIRTNNLRCAADRLGVERGRYKEKALWRLAGVRPTTCTRE